MKTHFPASAEDLNRQFPVAEISHLPGNNARYVKWTKLVERLNTEYGPQNWSCTNLRVQIISNEIQIYRHRNRGEEPHRFVTAEAMARIQIHLPDGTSIIREASSSDSSSAPCSQEMGMKATEIAAKTACTNAFKKAVSMLGNYWNPTEAEASQSVGNPQAGSQSGTPASFDPRPLAAQGQPQPQFQPQAQPQPQFQPQAQPQPQFQPQAQPQPQFQPQAQPQPQFQPQAQPQEEFVRQPAPTSFYPGPETSPTAVSTVTTTPASFDSNPGQKPPFVAPTQAQPDPSPSSSRMPAHIIAHFQAAVDHIDGINSFDGCQSFKEEQQKYANQCWGNLPDELHPELSTLYHNFEALLRARIATVS